MHIIKPIFSYGIGNILNTVAIIIMLPTLVYMDNDKGFSVAQGMLVGQVVSIFGLYAFSLTIPRTMEIIKINVKQILIFELLIFQFSLGFLGIGVIYLFQNNLNIESIYGFFILYSTVMQLQWYHIKNKTYKIQVILIIYTRLILILIQIYILTINELSSNLIYIFLPVATILFCIPVIPTLLILNLKKLRRNYRIQNFGELLYSEIKKGRQLFFASLLSSVYSLGPSLIITLINPSLLVAIQQFDRVRMAISNFSGIILGAIYPFLIGISRDKLVTSFKKIQKYILIPVVLLNLTLIMIVLFLPIEEFKILNILQMTNTSIGLSIIAGIFAASSNTITLTIIHPTINDKFYLKIIFIGALIFNLLAIIFYMIFQLNIIEKYLMLSVTIAECLINIFLWVKAKKIINKYIKGS